MEKVIQPCIAALAIARPDIAIVVTRTRDENFQWDGDGPDPAEDGFDAYDVDVKAFSIRNGQLLEGSASLGGSYFREDEPTAEIHGYLPQMVEEAVEELDALIAKKAVTL